MYKSTQINSKFFLKHNQESWQPGKELPNKQIMQVLKRTTREEQTVAESIWVVCFVMG